MAVTVVGTNCVLCMYFIHTFGKKKKKGVTTPPFHSTCIKLEMCCLTQMNTNIHTVRFDPVVEEGGTDSGASPGVLFIYNYQTKVPICEGALKKKKEN